MATRSAAGSVAAGRSTKEAIRDAAIRLFSVKGFDQTSLREVADAVGITKASLYYHYASKLDLLLAVIEPIFDELRANVDVAEGLAHDPTAVREVLAAQLRVLLRNRTAGAMCVRDSVTILNALGDRYPDLLDIHRRLCTWLAGPDPDDAAMLRASAALEMLSSVFWSRELAPGADDELIERVLLNAALGVLGGE
ncbi:TetR/AcrR family transcriptional regulator [Nocardia miyunensis]|uniref:TetR/AcrR family transcriptional regulator n=1 Tax=Nocardia miyunensis TaxID=282684 RepID=UPI000834621F|nr:TetR/AcrR family transcriptional regulator [Nocardia miyunensis]